MIIARFQIGPKDVAVVVSVDQQGPNLFIVTAETDDDVQFRHTYSHVRLAFDVAVELTEGPIDDAIATVEDESMRTQDAFPQRDETFRIEESRLVRAVTPRRGKPYEHRCDRETFVAVLVAINERQGASFVYEEIRDAINAPASQVATAFAFLRAQSCIVAAAQRRSVAATEDAYLDGMTEFFALEAQA